MDGQPIKEIINGENYHSVKICSVILLYQKEGIYDINKQNLIFHLQLNVADQKKV